MATAEIVINARLSPILSKGIRAVIEETLIQHQRMTIRACGCGWDELGRSHATHVADAIMEQL